MSGHVEITKLLPIPKNKEEAYIILEIPNGTVGKAITDAYKRRAPIYHPDKHRNCDDNCRKLAEESTKAINVAREKLEDEVQKTEYSKPKPDKHKETFCETKK